MFGKRLHLFDLFGFSVSVDLSWLIIAALIVWSLAGALFPTWYPDFPTRTYVFMGLGGAVGLFISVVWHELSHSLVARAFGMPMGGITLFVFGGIAEMENDPESPRSEFLMAVAGPVSSIVLSAIAFGLYFALDAMGTTQAVIGVLYWMGIINLVLAAFNMVPGFPLDGGRALRALLWGWKNDLRWATRSAAEAGSGFGAALIGMGILSLILLGQPVQGLWWILIGFFVRSAAQSSYQQMLVTRMLQGEPVRRFMNDQPVTVPSQTTLEDFVENYLYQYHHKMYPITDGEALQGCLHVRQIHQVPREEWSKTPVVDVAGSCDRDSAISPQTDALDALSRMRQQESGRLLVLEDGKLAGILTLRDLLEFLALKTEMEEGVPAEAVENAAGVAG